MYGQCMFNFGPSLPDSLYKCYYYSDNYLGRCGDDQSSVGMKMLFTLLYEVMQKSKL